MTSNLGAAFGTGPGIGFDADRRSFSLAAVEKAVTESFRSEFLNRIDRVVVFRPLARASVRKVLEIELARVFERRGLQSRDWAVEWDNSALEFLLDKGYSQEMGARPLKRAIERYLLSPLAQTIVEHEYPEGDQFLFIRASGDGLEVQFVDPDAPVGQAMPPPAALAAEAETSLRAIALQSSGSEREFALLCGAFERLHSIIESSEWEEHKDRALAAMSDPDFWQSEHRVAILSNIEFMDRIQMGLDTAGSLIGRLSGDSGTLRQYYRPDVLERLAQQLYLLDAACGSLVDETPRDAFVCIEAFGDARSHDGAALEAFAQDIVQMYLGWADKRRMRTQLYERDSPQNQAVKAVLAISGFGAYRLLLPERGLHVLELPRDESSFTRLKVRVRVAGQPVDAGADPAQLLALANESFSKSDEASPSVVRRYRREPSPLVRDNVRGYRTGHLDQVLSGDFDLFS